MEKNRKGLTAWQLTMMALGTVIGGSFFLGSAIAVHAAGPSVIISYIIGGILVYFILAALSEMTAANPDSGSFRSFATREFGPGTGFVTGWVYWGGMILAMSSEAAAVSILVRQWAPGISIAILGSLIIIIVTMLNLLSADKLSKIETSLATVKILAIVSFIVIALLLALGIIKGNFHAGGEVSKEAFMPGGIKEIAGSMLIVLFAYAGFEVIGLAAADTDNPEKTIPKAIKYTVIALTTLYILCTVSILLLIPTTKVNDNISPIVAALNRQGITWAGSALNFVLITAILSTMLAAMYGLGRMIRSLVDEHWAPKWLKDDSNVPYRGIIFSGISMLLGLGFGLLFPKVYLFLVSSGGFSVLFTYAVILASHIHFRKVNGKNAYASWIALLGIIIAILSMPFIKGQGSGLAAGIIMVALFSASYVVMRYAQNLKKGNLQQGNQNGGTARMKFVSEFSKEISKRKNSKRYKNRND